MKEFLYIEDVDRKNHLIPINSIRSVDGIKCETLGNCSQITFEKEQNMIHMIKTYEPIYTIFSQIKEEQLRISKLKQKGR